jgi:hypothetical protein
MFLFLIGKESVNLLRQRTGSCPRILMRCRVLQVSLASHFPLALVTGSARFESDLPTESEKSSRNRK